MKILVVFTGGTIGSIVTNGTIVPSETTQYELLNSYRKLNKEDVDFYCVEPYSILSENLSADNINCLVDCVNKEINNGFGGIIIAHGTDTIHYTASVLSYVLGEVKVPVILVSSNYPLSNVKSNGGINFEAGVEFIKNKAGKGVFISYANQKDCVTFHVANMALLHQETDDKIFSIKSNEYAVYKDNKIFYNNDYKPQKFGLPLKMCKLNKNSKILVVNSYPGNDYDYNIDNYKAIIFRPYHSGTLNTNNKQMQAFCKNAKDKGIPSFIVNNFSGDIYESSKIYSELGIIVLPLSTFASIYMKLWIAISCDYDIKEFMQKPLASEFYMEKDW